MHASSSTPFFEIKITARPRLLVKLFGSSQGIDKIALFPHSDHFVCQFIGNMLPEDRESIIAWCTGYGQGQPSTFPIPLIFSNLTPFTCKTLEALTQIPFGKTQTYAATAKFIHHPKAIRAIGGACGRNPFPLVIPCHRVVSSTGLGGFSCGLDIKKELLSFEKSI